jgi:hypothetical protein
MTTKHIEQIELPVMEAQLFPVSELRLDLDNPRLQTGADITADNEEQVIEALADIAALDELVTSICTNQYQNLEPLIVYSANGKTPFKVLEGNRRLAAIRLINNPALADSLSIKIPKKITSAVLKSINNVLVYRVENPDDARAFIGFKHINGPQRWDAYAKAKYVTEWYKKALESIGIDEIAAKMGDNNNTLRAYIYAILILEQAEKTQVWAIKDRYPARGRFAFSHLYTALGRAQYQEYLGLTEGWSNTPPLEPIEKKFLGNLGEVLSFIYGSKSDDRENFVKSQNPDLKNLGLAIVHEEARLILKNRGTLEVAMDALKDPSDAFHDALISTNLKISRAIELMPKYKGGRDEIDDLILQIYEQADTLHTMNERKKSRGKKHGD